MDVSLLIRQRSKKLGLEQKDLAVAAEVTESYISQLLTRKKVPPAPARTGIYDKIGALLRLPGEDLARLANLQRQRDLNRKVTAPPRALFQECRALVLRKCAPVKRLEIEAIFSRDPFGELERLVTQTLLDAAHSVAKAELANPTWQRTLARLRRRNVEQIRAAAVQLVDADLFSASFGIWTPILDSFVRAWDVDLRTFAIEILLNPQLTATPRRRYAFAEQVPPPEPSVAPGLTQFLADSSLSGDVTVEEVEFLRSLTFRDRKPSALYYYRELQNLRDPLHFLSSVPPKRPPK